VYSVFIKYIIVLLPHANVAW